MGAALFFQTASAAEDFRRIQVVTQTCGAADAEPLSRAIALEFSLIGLETTGDDKGLRLDIQTECFENTGRYSQLRFWDETGALLLESDISIPLSKHKTLALAASDFVEAGLKREMNQTPLSPQVSAQRPTPPPALPIPLPEWHFSFLQRNHPAGDDYRVGLSAAYSTPLGPHWLWSLGVEGSMGALWVTQGTILSTQASGVGQISTRWIRRPFEFQWGPRVEVGWSHAFAQAQPGFQANSGNALNASLGLDGLWLFRGPGRWHGHLGAHVSYSLFGLDAPFDGDSLLLQKGLLLGFRIGLSRNG